MTDLEVFRAVAPEFRDVDDDTVCTWIELTKPLCGRRVYGKMWAQAVALRTAHRMKMAGFPLDTQGEVSSGPGSVSAGFGVASYTEGSTSVSFNNANVSTGTDAEYALTTYGIQYLQLRRSHVVPIRSAGEY